MRHDSHFVHFSLFAPPPPDHHHHHSLKTNPGKGGGHTIFNLVEKLH